MEVRDFVTVGLFVRIVVFHLICQANGSTNEGRKRGAGFYPRQMASVVGVSGGCLTIGTEGDNLPPERALIKAELGISPGISGAQ